MSYSVEPSVSLGSPGFQAVGFDFHDQFAELLFVRKQRDDIVVTLAHLAAVEACESRCVFADHRIWDDQNIAIAMIEALRDVARHFQMLLLVTTDRGPWLT